MVRVPAWVYVVLWSVTTLALATWPYLPGWTGNPSSRTWPFAAAPVLAVLFGLVLRWRCGLGPTLIASAGGVVTGMGIGRVVLHPDRLGVALVMTLVPAIFLAWMLAKGLRQEEELAKEFGEFEALAPAEKFERIQEKFIEIDALSSRLKWNDRLLTLLVIAGTVLVGATLFVSPSSATPVGTAFSAAILILGCAYLVFRFLNRPS